jgi:hypothetical protein
MTWKIGMPPKDMLVALVVRRWVCMMDGTNISFIARDPVKHMALLNSNLQFEPSQTVVYGRLADEEGNYHVLDEDGIDTHLDPNAILAWSRVPSFAMNCAAAAQTDMLLRRVRQKV